MIRARLAVALLGAILCACSVQPIPLSAQKGSTIAIALTGGWFTYVGFTALGYEDKQFGTTHAYLVPEYRSQDGCDPNAISDPNTFEAPIRWITSVFPDPGSPAAIENVLPSTHPLGRHLFGQVVAVIDIPQDENLTPGLYVWCFETELAPKMVDPTPGGDYEGELFRRAINNPRPPMGPFQVLEGTGDSTPMLGYGGSSGGLNVWPDLERLIPYHTLSLRYQAVNKPAAADILITYPKDRIEIQTVFEERNLGRASIVLWDANTSGTQGELRIQYADPQNFADDDLRVKRLAVAFDVIRLVDPEDPDAVTPIAVPSDFTVDETKSRFYDGDGNDVSSSVRLIPQRIR